MATYIKEMHAFKKSDTYYNNHFRDTTMTSKVQAQAQGSDVNFTNVGGKL